jgi:hypothetical protein
MARPKNVGIAVRRLVTRRTRSSAPSFFAIEDLTIEQLQRDPDKSVESEDQELVLSPAYCMECEQCQDGQDEAHCHYDCDRGSGVSSHMILWVQAIGIGVTRNAVNSAGNHLQLVNSGHLSTRRTNGSQKS